MTGLRFQAYAPTVGGRNKLMLTRGIPCLALSVLFLLFWSRNVMSQTLALFPLLDLTVGSNGINSVLTDSVRRETEALGFELVAEQEVMQFMIRHHIRSLGRLTSHEVSLAGEEMGADLVLQGTVCQLQEYMPASVSLSLQLIRTSDASMVWAHTEGLYYADLLSLLGLSDPKTMEDLYRVFFPRLLADIPGGISPAEKKEELLNIDTVVLLPNNVRPGETVVCKIRFFPFRQDDETLPSIVARVDEQEHPLALDEEGYYYEASWPAQDKAGEYIVTLVVNWPSGRSRSGIIGTYYVDDHEPALRLHAVGKDIDGTTAFSDKLIMVPQLIDPEPVSRWLIEVFNEEGGVIVRQGASGHIPWQIRWGGKTNSGELAPDGTYRIVLNVWDRAGRESAAETEVSFLRMPPKIDIEVSTDNGTVTVDLVNTKKTPVAFWWMKFFDADGRQLKLAEGVSLPATVELETPLQENGEEIRLEGLLQVCDIMGNQTTMKIQNLMNVVEEETEEGKLEMEWVEEF